MEDTRQRDYEGEVYARIAFPALWKPPETRTAAEVKALETLCGKPRSATVQEKAA